MKFRICNIIRDTTFIINFVIILFIWFITYYTTAQIMSTGDVRGFLEGINKIPITSSRMIMNNLILFGIFCMSTYLRERRLEKFQKYIHVFTALDICICFLILKNTNFSHKGIFFLAISNMVSYLDGKKKYLIIIASVFIYIFIDYDILSTKFSIFSINSYIESYNAKEQMYFFTIRNILYSMNEVLFIIFLIFSIQMQVDETKKIKSLYTEIEKAYADLKEANIELETYSKKSDELVRIKERNRLSREIHDTLGHTLTAVVMGIGACLEIIDIDLEKTKLQLVKVLDMSKKGLKEIRRSVNELRPDTLEKQPLTKVLDDMVYDINALNKTKINLNIIGVYRKLQDDEDETVYRTVQESITNAIRHGKASVVNVVLSFKESEVVIEILDNGIGCIQFNEGFGTKHIKERIELLSGTVSFTCEESGVKVLAKIPMRW